MVRPQSVLGEKPLFWTGASKDELMEFPVAVKDEIGIALSVAQFGGKPPKAKPWKGEGPGILEIVADHGGDTYRAVYTANSSMRFTCCMRSRRSRRRAERRRRATWS